MCVYSACEVCRIVYQNCAQSSFGSVESTRNILGMCLDVA